MSILEFIARFYGHPEGSQKSIDHYCRMVDKASTILPTGYLIGPNTNIVEYVLSVQWPSIGEEAVCPECGSHAYAGGFLDVNKIPHFLCVCGNLKCLNAVCS
jgi:hypothetical protein